MGQTAVASREAAQRAALDVEKQVTETVGRWSASLLRTARRHSLCDADAEDAYQRTLELYLRHVGRLDPERVHLWLHTVAKHEAMAVREKRVKHVAPDDVDLDRIEGRTVPSPEERAVEFERLERAADALGALKPAEVRALWLQAHGMSYREIASATEWTYTKVNRCLTEGRRAFLRAYEGLEAGTACAGFEDALGRVAAGEMRPRQVPGLQAHLRHCGWCRAGLRERRAPAALAILLPAAGVPVVGGGATAPEAATHAVVRLFETLVLQAHERATGAAVRAQATFDAVLAGGGKAAAVAASAAALAGGGAVAAEEVRGRVAAPGPAEDRRAAARPLAPAGDLVRTLAPAGAGPAASEVRVPTAAIPLDRPVRARPRPAAPRPGSAAARGRRRVPSRSAAGAEFGEGDAGGRDRREFGDGAPAAAPAQTPAAPAPVTPTPAPVAAAPTPAPAPVRPSPSFESSSGSTGDGEFGG